MSDPAPGRDGADFPPDPFGRLWTPHRMAYIRGEGADGGCPFCRIPGGDDAEGLIVARGAACYVVLNRYPYNPGHLMVVPYRHVADLEEVDPVELAELGTLAQRAIRALRASAAPAGFNVGLNLGTVAGAGIAAHLHQHVVPRWGGDTNFMPVVGGTRVLPQLLADSREALVAAWR